MALSATHLADKSALARMPHPAVAARVRPLLEDGAIATCAIVDLEILFSARNLSNYDAVRLERQSLDDVPITPAIMARSLDISTSWPDAANNGCRYRTSPSPQPPRAQT